MTFTRPHSDEVFPTEVNFRNPWTREEFQGGVNTCLTFGVTSPLEAMAHAVGENVQLSPRFLWYYRNRQSLSVESMVATLNSVSTCADHLCPYVVDPTYPYAVHDLDIAPDLAALLDAAKRNIKIEIQRISDKYDCMRALANGQTLITVRVGGNLEHCECAIGYHQDKGLLIHGSGSTIFWEPWSSLGLIITQVYAITKSPWAPRVHPDYRAPTPASFAEGVLTCPFIAQVDPDWMKPLRWFKNVKAHFSGEIAPGSLVYPDPNVTGYNALWKPRGPGITDDRLELPQVEVGGTLYKGVSVNGVAITIIAGEEIP